MEEQTITQLQNLMEEGKLSSAELTSYYLSRIQEIDRNGPKLNSVIEINPKALDTAHALDIERGEKGARGPLHGIPLLIKDNFDTGDEMQTTAGSLALQGFKARQDAFVVQKLRQAGVVILGKANLSEWANFRSSHSSSGWSSRGGQTHNPYALDRNPCGSSSGSAVAVSANLCAAALGTETDGSVVCPSHANGIVGLKPTIGLLSRRGIIPISHSQDTAGPMGRTVEDVAILLGAMAGEDANDPITLTSRGKSHSDYTHFLDKGALKGKRLGVARNFFGFNEHVDRCLENALQVFRDAGAVLVDEVEIATKEDLSEPEIEVLLYEFKDSLNKYLAAAGEQIPLHTMEEIIAFNAEHADTVMPYFGQDRMERAQAKGPLTDEAYLKALETCHKLAREEGIDATLQKDNLDAILAPTGGPAWYTDWVNGDHYAGGSSSPAAVAGYPNITVPAGFVFGLPVGISIFSSAYQEPLLLGIAYAFEQAGGFRQPPRFLAHVEFDQTLKPGVS